VKTNIGKYVAVVEAYAKGRYTLGSVERRLHRLDRMVDLAEEDAFAVGLIQDFVSEVSAALGDDWEQSGDDGHLRFEAAQLADELRELAGF
jgi:hypothetical protein